MTSDFCILKVAMLLFCNYVLLLFVCFVNLFLCWGEVYLVSAVLFHISSAVYMNLFANVSEKCLIFADFHMGVMEIRGMPSSKHLFNIQRCICVCFIS